MKFGFNKSVNNHLLDNIDEDIPLTNSANTPVMSHRSFVKKRNPVTATRLEPTTT